MTPEDQSWVRMQVWGGMAAALVASMIIVFGLHAAQAHPDALDKDWAQQHLPYTHPGAVDNETYLSERDAMKQRVTRLESVLMRFEETQ